MFKKGTRVQISNHGRTYNTLQQAADLLELSNYTREVPDYSTAYIVIGNCFHPSGNVGVICAIESPTGQQHLIHEEGLKEYEVDWKNVEFGTRVIVWDKDYELFTKKEALFVLYNPNKEVKHRILVREVDSTSTSFSCIAYNSGELV